MRSKGEDFKINAINAILMSVSVMNITWMEVSTHYLPTVKSCKEKEKNTNKINMLFPHVKQIVSLLKNSEFL